jgi:voltage-gated potassium channel
MNSQAPSIKSRIYSLLSASDDTGSASWFVDVFIMTLIVLNVVSVVVETIPNVKAEYSTFFYRFEVFSVIIFTAEYVLRIWTSTIDPRFSHAVTGRLRYMGTPMSIIDLLAILPFYLPFLGVDMRHFRILRMFRLFRLLKIARYVDALTVIVKVFSKKKEELAISLAFTLLLLLLASSMMYYVENAAQPDAFSSIPETMWWGIATLTTVGYGDVYPITGFGRLLGGIIAIIGIGLFALPTGILASGFSDELTKHTTSSKSCPKCGHEVVE